MSPFRPRPLAATPLAATPLAATPLAATPLAATPLAATLLGLCALAAALWGVLPTAHAQEPFAQLRPAYSEAAGRALVHFRARRYAEALQAAEGGQDSAARLVAARSLLALRRFADAVPILRDLADKEPLLADHFRARAARAALGAGDALGALTQALLVQEETPILAEGVLVAADAAGALGRQAVALVHARRFLEKWPEKPGAAAALWLVARAEEAAGNGKAAKIAKQRIASEFPESPLAERVGDVTLTSAQALARADKLVAIHRNAKAVPELERLLRRTLDKPQRCKATYLLGAAQQRLRRHKGAFAALRRASSLCKGDELGARVLFLWGKGLLNGRGPAVAARILERLATEYPQHRFADDALLLAAQGWRRAGEPARAKAALLRLLRDVPTGDMAPKARFDLATLEAKEGDLDGAATRLRAMADETPYPDDAYLRGRPLYALGKLEHKRGRSAAAKEAWTRCVKEHPHTFWAALARGHLRAVGQSVEEPDVSGAPTPDALAWPALPETLLQSKAFQRAAALIRLGAGDFATPEVALAAKEAGRTEEVRAALSLLYYFAGDWHRSHRIIRWKMKDALARPPTAERRRFFLLAYPRGYWEFLETQARKQKVDPLLLVALVREESAFNATIESWANAVGLGQFIWSTAKRMAQVLRIRGFHRGMLIDPAVNLKLAAKYLSNLLRRFRGVAPLAVAAYNAGELAVERWLRERPGLPLDEFVAAIPYEQTRHYTRRVMESFATYRLLYAEGAQRFLALGPRHARQRDAGATPAPSTVPQAQGAPAEEQGAAAPARTRRPRSSKRRPPALSPEAPAAMARPAPTGRAVPAPATTAPGEPRDE